MDEKYLEFLEKNVPSVYKFLSTDCDNMQNQDKKSREDCFSEGLKSTKAKAPKLVFAIYKATKNATVENIRNVVKKSADMDDFVTALFWHEKLSITLPKDLNLKFERFLYNLLATAQKKKNPDAKPLKSFEDLVKNSSDVSKALADEKYGQVECEYNSLKEKEYKEKFNSPDFEKYIKPIDKKSQKADTFAGIFMLFMWGLGIFALWKTFPMVWAWARGAFGPFFFVLPLVYAVVLIICALLVSTIFLSEKDKILKKAFVDYESKIISNLHQTEEYKTLCKMNEGLPTEYRTYSKRLLLALISAITGEKDLKKLVAFEQKEREYTWLCTSLSDFGSSKPTKANSKVLSLAKKDATDEDLALASVLYVRSLHESLKKDWAEISSGNQDSLKAFWSLRRLMKRDPAYQNALGKPFDNLFDFQYHFLQKEYESAKASSNTTFVGEVCWRIYELCESSHGYNLGGRNDFGDIAYRYGLEGVKYSEKLKFYAMRYHACYDDTRNFKLALGFDRDDVKAYMNELKNKGDVRWKELQKSLTSAASFEDWAREEREKREWEEERAARRAQIQAQEEQKARLRRELEEKADALERDVNFALTGEHSTIEEQRIMGRVSDADAMRAKDIRDEIIDKKVDDAF